MNICAAHLSGRCPTPTNCSKPHASPRTRNPWHRPQSRSSLSSEVDASVTKCSRETLGLQDYLSSYFAPSPGVE